MCMQGLTIQALLVSTACGQPELMCSGPELIGLTDKKTSNKSTTECQQGRGLSEFCHRLTIVYWLSVHLCLDHYSLQT